MVAYSSMITTGVNWIPQIPSHWELRKIDALFTERRQKVSDKEYEPLSVTKNGVLPQLEHAAKSNDSDNRKLVKSGDFVINSRSDRKGSCGISQRDGSVSLINLVLTPRCGLNREYIHYLLRNYRFSEEYYRNGRGIVADLWTTRYSEMRTIQLPIPPRAEQDQIVRFLDWKVSEINKLIHIKKELIERISEKLLVKTNYLLTHGKKTHDAFIRTAMDWAPEIPNSWSVSRIRNHFEILKRIAGKEGYDVFSITQQGLKVRNVHLYEGQLAADYSGYQFVSPGEFAMNHMDLLTGGVGIAEHFGVTSPDYRVFKLFDDKRCYAPYYLYIFQLCYRRHAFYRFGRGAATVGRWRLPADAFKNFEIPVPPYDEQVEIVGMIDKEAESTKIAIEYIQRQIENLKELKSVIISDVVTGKIDVRNITIPAYEHVDDVADDDTDNDNEAAEAGEEEG